MITVENFVRNFHNLEGFTVGEKRRILFILLNSWKSANAETVDSLVSCLTPKTHLELVFRIEVLLFLRRTAELYEVLKSGNEELSSKIFENRWFFQNAFNNLSAEDIVNDLLICLSYVTRNRVIRSLAKYSRDEVKLDSIFDLLVERYGINSAKLIVAGCSVDKIEKVITTYKIELDRREVVALFNKSPNLFTIYIKNNSRCQISDSFIWTELLVKETDMYFDIDNWCRGSRLGKKSTRRLLNHNRNVIISESSYYVRVMHLKTVYKCLGHKDSLRFFINLFPKEASNGFCSKFSYGRNRAVSDFLQQFPRKDRFQIYSESYEQVYSKSIWDDISSSTPECLLSVIENAEEREKIIRLVTKHDHISDKYVEFYKIDNSIGLIKERLSNRSTSVGLKAGLANKLVFVCKFNNDIKSLSDVLDYFCKYHRNDEKLITFSFLSALSEHFQLSDLSSEHWKNIFQLLELCKNRNEDFKKRNDFILHYVLYLWKNKEYDREKIVNFILNGDIGVTAIKDLCKLSCEELEKNIIVTLIEYLPQIIKKNQTLHEVDTYCALSVLDWNKDHQANKVMFRDHPRLIDSLKLFVGSNLKKEEYKYSLAEVFVKFICTKEQYEFTDYIKTIYLQFGAKVYQKTKISLWLLKYDLKAVLNCPDNFLKGICRRYTFKQIILNYIKKSPELCNKALKYFLEIQGDAEFRDKLFASLAFLMDPGDYVNLVSRYIPAKERLDMDDAESKSNYGIQQAVAKSFKYSKSATVLPTLVGFCIGDYLGSALESLYYLFYHSPENKLDIFVKDLSSRAVSVRKHAFFLTSQVGSIQNLFELLKPAIEHEKNLSVKKHLLNVTLRHFKKNPTDKNFELFISCIPSLNVVDGESLEALVRLREMPSEYRGKFIMFLLPFLRSLAEENSEVSEFCDSLLRSVSDSDIMQLTPDFCLAFIDKYFLKGDKCFSESNINSFVSNYLFYCKQDNVEKVNAVLKKLHEFRKADEHDFETKFSHMRKIDAFVTSVLQMFIYSNDLLLLKTFYNTFIKLFSVEEFFTSYVSLCCLLFKMEYVNYDHLAKKVRDLKEEILAKFSINLLRKFAAVVSEQFRSYKNDDDLYRLCISLSKINGNLSDSLLLLYLLPRTPPTDEVFYEAYLNILDSFETHPDVLISSFFSASLPLFTFTATNT